MYQKTKNVEIFNIQAGNEREFLSKFTLNTLNQNLPEKTVKTKNFAHTF